MFNPFKKKPESAPMQTPEEILAEHNYRMEHDPAYKLSIEQSAAFFKADSEAREKAGLTDLPGEYTFECPNCGSLCKGSWTDINGKDNLHGQTGCHTCDIHLIV